MFTGFLFVNVTVLLGVFFILCYRWSYVCLCALVEVCWVSLAYAYGLLAVDVGDQTLLFWGLAALFFSAVELCLCLFAFVVLADLRGDSPIS